MKLELTPLANVPDISPGSPLGSLLKEACAHSGWDLAAADVIVVAQKIVSKAEGRIIRLSDVVASERAVLLARQMQKDARMTEVILRESKRVVRVRGDVLICETHHGFICANAGVDRSNVDGGESVTLLPRNPDSSAQRLASELGCGVVITDTFGRPWREGLVDVAIGVAGIPCFIDYRGASDSHGYPLHASILAAADALAATAGLVMGKTSGIPAVLVRGFETSSASGRAVQMLRPVEKDLFL